MKMINIKEYFEVNEEKHKFELPISFLGQIKFQFFKNFFKYFELSDRVFIEGGLYGKYYWSVLLGYLQNKYGITFHTWPVHFRGRFLTHSTQVGSKDDDFLETYQITGSAPDWEDKEVSLSKAIGEFLERYNTYYPQDNDLKRIKMLVLGEVTNKVKTVRDFHRFSETQLERNKHFQLEDDMQMPCIEVESLQDSKTYNYPIQQIFWGNGKLLNRYNKFCLLTTSGCAGGFDLESATLGAIYESVERDAFFCHWITSTSPKIINFKKGDLLEVDILKDKLHSAGVDMYILDTTTNIQIPSIICLIRDRHDRGFYVTGGANLNPRLAILSAIKEMSSIISEFDFKDRDSMLPSNYQPFSDYSMGRLDRLDLARHPYNRSQSDFLIKGESANYVDFYNNFVEFNDKKQELKKVLEIFENLGDDYEHVYRFDSQAQVLKDLNYKVVRVIVPKLYPLYLNENSAMTDSDRLTDFAKWKTGDKNFVINTFPHPFP